MEPDDIDDLDDLLMTGHECGSCDKDIYTTDEVTLIQVVYPTIVKGKVVNLAIDDENGEYEYPPCFVHLDCWEELFEPMEFKMDGIEAIKTPGSIASCFLCESDIKAWETTGLISHGEIRISPRCPQGEISYYFEPCFGEKHLCLSCLATLNSDLFEMWDRITHNDECIEGLHSRCWRRNPCLECRRA